ncbi:MAG: hypothetical protein AB7O28_18240 [Vicinamibacterales bacterium]
MSRLGVVMGVALAVAAAGCGDGPGGNLTGPTVVLGGAETNPGGGATIGYVQDIKPILDADCVECHGPRRREHNVDLSTYQNVLRNLTPGNANSNLIRQSGRNGAMYRYWRGDAAAKAELVRRWVVEFQARENR